MALGRGLPVKLGRGTGLSIEVKQQYRLIEENANPYEPWRVRTVAYYYTLLESDGPEIISYQWHPNQHSTVTFPHLHLGRGAKTGRTELGEAHLPTGRVALEEFVNLVIEDFNVLPVRDDWKEALQASRAEFAADRSWG